MHKQISTISIIVPDYDEAITHYVKDLGFTLLEDTPLGGPKRWVTVSPSPKAETALLLAQASNPQQAEAIGDQCAGRVLLILETIDFEKSYKFFVEKGVTFAEEPRVEKYGKVAVFLDKFGNKWDLIERY